MSISFLDILWLYAPFLGSILIVFIIFTKDIGGSGFFHLRYQEFEFPIKRSLASKLFLSVLAASFLSKYLLMDVAKFFPPHLTMNVFFDEKGIKDSMLQFDEEQRARLDYRGENIQAANEYRNWLNNEIETVLGYANYFPSDTVESQVTSRGSTSFIVEKTDWFHRYTIKESMGRLEHMREGQGQDSKIILSLFEKKSSRYDFIRPSLTEVFLDHEVLIQPRFKQIIAEQYTSTNQKAGLILIGATKLNLLFYPNFDNTVYFYYTKEHGAIPIAYAVYDPYN